jgi:exodeoxyribonuclease VII small subunit
MTSTQGTLSFEQAFSRLEAILERMNAQDVPLEESLALFEEASSLITVCHKRLVDAERRVEVLVKNRQGELSLSPSGQPQTTPLEGERESL